MKIPIPPHVKLLILTAYSDSLDYNQAFSVVGDWMLSMGLQRGEYLLPYDPRNAQRYCDETGFTRIANNLRPRERQLTIEQWGITIYNQNHSAVLHALQTACRNGWSLRP